MPGTRSASQRREDEEPAWQDAIAALTEQVTRLATRMEQIGTQVTTLAARSTGSPSPGPATPVTPRPTPPVETKEPKAADVGTYDGSKTRELRTWLGQCQATFILQPSRFVSARSKILFIGQHLAGRPSTWFITTYLEHIEDRPELFSDVTAFRADLISNWGDPDAQRTAVNFINNMKQYSKPAKEHIADFLTYSSDTGFNNPALIEHLRSTLRPEIKDELARMDTLPVDIDAYCKLVIKIDNRVVEREKERKFESNRKLFLKPNDTITKPTVTTSNANGIPDGTVVSSSTTASRKVEPVSKEVRDARFKERRCLNCGDKNHIAKACPNPTKLTDAVKE